jgi:hypothetical protein
MYSSSRSMPLFDHKRPTHTGRSRATRRVPDCPTTQAAHKPHIRVKGTRHTRIPYFTDVGGRARRIRAGIATEQEHAPRSRTGSRLVPSLARRTRTRAALYERTPYAHARTSPNGHRGRTPHTQAHSHRVEEARPLASAFDAAVAHHVHHAHHVHGMVVRTPPRDRSSRRPESRITSKSLLLDKRSALTHQHA